MYFIKCKRSDASFYFHPKMFLFFANAHIQAEKLLKYGSVISYQLIKGRLAND